MDTHTHTNTHTQTQHTRKGESEAGDGHHYRLVTRHMHACMHTYIHTYIHTYMHAYIHTYTYTHTRTHTHAHTTQRASVLTCPNAPASNCEGLACELCGIAIPAKCFFAFTSGTGTEHDRSAYVTDETLLLSALSLSPFLSLSLSLSRSLSLSLAFSLSLSLFHSLKNKNKNKNKTSLRDNQDCFLEGPDVFQVPKCKCLRANIENLAYKTREYTHTRAHIHTFMHACARTHAALDHARACKHTEDDNTFDVQFESIMLCFHCLTSHKKENENLVYIGPPKHQGANCKALYLCLICMPYMWYERTCQSCLSLQADGNHCIICMYVLYVCLIFMPLRMTYMTWNDLYDLKALAKAALSLVSGNSGLQFPISCLKLQC